MQRDTVACDGILDVGFQLGDVNFLLTLIVGAHHIATVSLFGYYLTGPHKSCLDFLSPKLTGFHMPNFVTHLKVGPISNMPIVLVLGAVMRSLELAGNQLVQFIDMIKICLGLITISLGLGGGSCKRTITAHEDLVGG